MKKWITAALIFLGMFHFKNRCLAQNGIAGTLFEGKTTEIPSNGFVLLFKNGIKISQVRIDENGHYSFPNLDPGQYDVEGGSIGFPNLRITDIYVKMDVVRLVDIHLLDGVCEDFTVYQYQIPLLEMDNLTSGHTYFNNDIRRAPIAKSN